MAKAGLLTSAANPLLRDVRRAVLRGALTTDGCCIAETFHLLGEALGSGLDVAAVLAAQSARQAVEKYVRRANGVRVFVLPDALFRKVSATESSQGVMTLVRPPAWRLDQLFGGQAMVVVIDGIQDPGNAGAILRAAEAFAASGVILLKGTVSPFNPKAVRASAGSVFRLPFVHGVDASLALAALEERKLDVYSATPDGKKSLAQADLRRECAFIIGSEGRGVSERLRAGAVDLKIPLSRVESLNAAMAAGILLYEARRQRTALR
jgi:TrmH family RNA methyltransferase